MRVSNRQSMPPSIVGKRQRDSMSSYRGSERSCRFDSVIVAAPENDDVHSDFQSHLRSLAETHERLQQENCQLRTEREALQVEVERLQKISQRRPMKPGGDMTSDSGDLERVPESDEEEEVGQEDDEEAMRGRRSYVSSPGDVGGLIGSGRSPTEILEQYETLVRQTKGRNIVRSVAGKRGKKMCSAACCASVYDFIKTPHLKLTWLEKFKDSNFFTTCVSLAILANTFFILAESDLKVRSIFTEGVAVDTNPYWIACGNLLFMIFFATELAIRLLAEEGIFFIGDERRWNLFDAMLVAVSFIEVLLTFSEVDPAMLRWMRILRLSRSLRVVRVFKIFRELRLLLGALLNILMPLMWSAFLLLTLILMFSIVFCYAAFSYVQDFEARGAKEGGTAAPGLEKYFGSVPTSSLSLFMSLTGGESWVMMINPLIEVHATYGLIFIMFTTFLQLGVLNVVTSIFVSAATTFAEHDTEIVQGSEADRQNVLTSRLNLFFDAFDRDGSGDMSFHEFETFSKDNKVKAFFEKVLGIQTWKIRRLFRLLDADGDQRLGKQEFMVGCLQMTGPAKNIDLEALRQLCHIIRRDLSDLGERIDTFGSLAGIRGRGATAGSTTTSRATKNASCAVPI